MQAIEDGGDNKNISFRLVDDVILNTNNASEPTA